MFAGAHLQPVKTIPSLQTQPDWVMQFSLPLLLPFKMSMQRAGRERERERGEPTRSTSREVIFLRGVGKGNGGVWLVVRLVRWQGGVQGLICFSDGGGSQQLSLFRLRSRLHPSSLRVSPAPHLLFVIHFTFSNPQANNVWISHLI